MKQKTGDQERVFQKENRFVGYRTSRFLHKIKNQMTKQIKLFEKQTEVFDILMDQDNGILELLIGGGA